MQQAHSNLRGAGTISISPEVAERDVRAIRRRPAPAGVMLSRTCRQCNCVRETHLFTIVSREDAIVHRHSGWLSRISVPNT